MVVFKVVVKVDQEASGPTALHEVSAAEATDASNSMSAGSSEAPVQTSLPRDELSLSQPPVSPIPTQTCFTAAEKTDLPPEPGESECLVCSPMC